MTAVSAPINNANADAGCAVSRAPATTNAGMRIEALLFSSKEIYITVTEDFGSDDNTDWMPTGKPLWDIKIGRSAGFTRMITPHMSQIVKKVPRKTESHLPSTRARTFRAGSPRGGAAEAYSSLFRGQAIQQTPSI